jgi:hypothetical protein
LGPAGAVLAAGARSEVEAEAAAAVAMVVVGEGRGRGGADKGEWRDRRRRRSGSARGLIAGDEGGGSASAFHRIGLDGRGRARGRSGASTWLRITVIWLAFWLDASENLQVWVVARGVVSARGQGGGGRGVEKRSWLGTLAGPRRAPGGGGGGVCACSGTWGGVPDLCDLARAVGPEARGSRTGVWWSSGSERRGEAMCGCDCESRELGS